MNRITFRPAILEDYFSDFVRFLCRSCKRYGHKASCPPYIDSVFRYKEIMTWFEYGVLVYKRYEFDKSDLTNWKKLGQESSLDIVKELELIRHQITYRKSYMLLGAGSCKNCETCSFPCRFPEKAITPLEATGIDVVKFFKLLTGIELKFPVEDYGHFFRIGAILWT